MGEHMEKKAAWEAQRAEKRVVHNGPSHGQQAAKLVDFDAKSDSTEATVSTMASQPVNAEEVQKIAAQDKDVRRCEKKLREIAKLGKLVAEGAVLDSLQVAKMAQRAEVEDLLNDAWMLAQARAREQLRRQA